MGVITHARPLTAHSVRIHRTAFSPDKAQLIRHHTPCPIRVQGHWLTQWLGFLMGVGEMMRPVLSPSSLMSTEVTLATSLYATWIVLTSQPTIPAACRTSCSCLMAVKPSQAVIVIVVWTQSLLGLRQAAGMVG
jgi:hypothetical protein